MEEKDKIKTIAVSEIPLTLKSNIGARTVVRRLEKELMQKLRTNPPGPNEAWAVDTSDIKNQGKSLLLVMRKEMQIMIREAGLHTEFRAILRPSMTDRNQKQLYILGIGPATEVEDEPRRRSKRR